MSEELRLLVVAETALADRVAGVLAGSDGGRRFDCARVGGVGEAVERLARAEADAVLLELPGRGEGVMPLVELRAGAPEVPVVVLAAADDEPLAVKAVQLGATDYLVVEQLYGTLLARCVQHAVERERVRARLQRYQEEWPPSLRPAADGEGRVAPLRTALPASFAELVEDYGRMLDEAVEQVLYRVRRPTDESIRDLARRIGELRAGPRDVVEVHSAAIKAREQEAGPQRMRLYSAEGQVRLLELMGHLVTFYRRLGSPAHRPRESA